MRLPLRLLFASALTSVSLAAVVIACSDDDTTAGTTPSLDGSADARARTDGGGEEEETGTDAPDAGKDAAKDARALRDANGPGEAGAGCVFNHDCQLSLRCGACDAGFCFCEPGVRGTGRNGIDACDAGEQCTSALCVEGPGDSGVSYCSDECEANADCTGMLPKCVSIPFFGDFCARDGG